MVPNPLIMHQTKHNHSPLNQKILNGINMISTIRIDAISSEKLIDQLFFVLHCTVLSGEIHKGQNLSLPFSNELDISIPIDELEQTSSNNMAIRIKVLCEDESDVDFLNGLDLENEVLNAF